MNEIPNLKTLFCRTRDNMWSCLSPRLKSGTNRIICTKILLLTVYTFTHLCSEHHVIKGNGLNMTYRPMHSQLRQSVQSFGQFVPFPPENSQVLRKRREIISIWQRNCLLRGSNFSSTRFPGTSLRLPKFQHLHFQMNKMIWSRPERFPPKHVTIRDWPVQ
jgi:hypothetical protein